MKKSQDKNKLQVKGAEFVERETQRFIDKVVGGKFVPEFVSNTEPPIKACYSRIPAAYKQLHIETWSSSRGQEIIDAAPTEHFMWNYSSGWCVTEHPLMSILLIWYDDYTQAVGLAGPTKPAVLSFAASVQRLYSSRILYTEAEVNDFNSRVVENVIYLQDFVHP